MITRFYVEKKENFNVESEKLLKDIKENLHVALKNIRIINTYDIKDLDDSIKEAVVHTVLSEPNVDQVSEKITFDPENAFRIKLLEGQFDQRSNSAVECSEIITMERLEIEASKIYVLEGNITEKDIEKIKDYLINPVENEIVPLKKPNQIKVFNTEISDVEIITGFRTFDEKKLITFANARGFAMDIEDLEHIQKYFLLEKRDPTITELKVLDTYWSDHCRHTTFLTKLEIIDFEANDYIKESFERYKAIRKEIKREKDITLMDLAVIMMKYQRAKGNLDNLDISEEVNACTINVPVDVNGKIEDYLIMFKNETHNHPTEIEPFGGASTCLGGAIRDPLSGRAYVYQGMRLTGAGDPRKPIEETLEGKIPQRIITKKAAQGFSSYGNQIGLATGLVDEVYDEGFLAKRMEVGAVVGATPKKDVTRKTPENGDLIVLLGGKTGRDGCGGATGSSKKHSEDSILTSGAEVQKGNAPEERKLQRLYRIPEFSKVIKKSNDFGAGGVSVAIGELADSLTVNLDKVPKKYQGLDGTELAISESQERMAIVIDPQNLQLVKKYCYDENVEATVVAEVKDHGRFIMKWQDKEIFNISREFIETNGVMKSAKVKVKHPQGDYFSKEKEKVKDLERKWLNKIEDLNICSKKGLSEMFDSTIGAGSVLMPYGGKYMKTPTQTMVAKVPVLNGETKTCTLMTYGYDPEIGKWSPYHGGVFNVLTSIAKIVSTGGNYNDIRFSFQEYFESLGNDPEKWGQPLAALLGTLKVLDAFDLAAIGGKDSMSGTFNKIHVPPTLISFALAPGTVENIISPEFKSSGHYVYELSVDLNAESLPNLEKTKKGYEALSKCIKNKEVVAAYAVTAGGLAESISKMAFGNHIGFTFEKNISHEKIFAPSYGSIVFESKEKIESDFFNLIGETIDEYVIKKDSLKISLETIEKHWEMPLDKIFPQQEETSGNIATIKYEVEKRKYSKIKVKKPKVFIPAFPGTNCEYDTKKAFEKVGGKAEIVVFKNLDKKAIEASIDQMVEVIKESQIIAIPGGFSAGDEPEGSGKFIASVFRNEKMKMAVEDLLNNRDGLIIGICNGFQALVKLGLLPAGKIKKLNENSPTLTFNKIGRHVSNISKVKISSNLSPWLKEADFDAIYETPMSHGEGRFYANKEVIKELIDKGQVATRYVDPKGQPTMNGAYNPNGSIEAIEGITSEDGRIFGKMGHVERVYEDILINIYDKKDMKIFESGIKYFTHE